MDTTKTLSTRLTKKLVERIEKALQSGLWLNESDFLRDAVRDKLDQIDRDSSRMKKRK